MISLSPFRASWPGDYPPAARLLDAAKMAREKAYAPYSGFSVGAALLVRGRPEFFTGCNVENSSYGLSFCAERSTAVAMVAAGKTHPLAVAIAGQDGVPCLPCGACRQFLAEFNPELLLVLDEGGTPAVVSLAALFPAPFLLNRENRP